MVENKNAHNSEERGAFIDLNLLNPWTYSLRDTHCGGICLFIEVYIQHGKQNFINLSNLGNKL